MATAMLKAIFLWVGSTTAQCPDCVSDSLQNNTICNSSTTPSTRAADLVSLLILDEKIQNMQSNSPGVPRLGIPAYNWWHYLILLMQPGATSFPQPIPMGAAFDDELIFDVATVISIEARAFSNFNRSALDFWTPNINPFLDPRWGRSRKAPLFVPSPCAH